MRRLPAVLCAPLAVLVLAACGSDDETSSSSASAPTAAAAGEDAGCPKVATPDPKPDGSLERPSLKIDRAATRVAVVKTSCGTFEITLDVKRAPKTSASFAFLARKRFFDGTIFHRVVPDFVIQGGDPTGTGTGGPGYSVEETPDSGLTYPVGTVAMAKTAAEAPGTSGSQFYVVVGEQGAQLPPEYALLGSVTEGDDVVQRIAAVPTAEQDRPVDPPVVESVRIRGSS
jgi:peptidyl-prolyl cis-trans isomerase B (cyclophilin B)